MTREAMQQALEALEELHRTGDTQVFDMCYAPKVIPALRRELEKPADEPVAWMLACAMDDFRHGRIVEVSRGKEEPDDIPLYTRPQPAREWVGLTDEERKQLWRDVIKWGDPSHDDVDLMKAIEAKLKEKNT